MLAQFMRVPQGAWSIVKEAARHLLHRPVVGIAAAARTADGRWLLVRRTDTGQWALPGGTLEWGETLHTAIVRELREEAGVDEVTLGELCGVYSLPARDARFHAVTIVVRATVSEPRRHARNPVEIAEVGLFTDDALPSPLSYTMGDMLRDAQTGRVVWE